MHSKKRALAWKNLPGNWDPLHSRDVFPSDNEYGIPTLAKCSQVPAQLIQWGSRPEMLAAGPDSAVHFFLDDYRFESLWKDPMRNFDALHQIGCVLSPDFSLFRDMPIAMQMWNVYRNRWLGCYWQAQGIQVIPTISWSKPHDFCYAGVERGSIVAVSFVGVNDRKACYLFREGFEKLIDVISPEAILAYGRLPKDIKIDTPVVTFPTRWEQQKVYPMHGCVSLWEHVGGQ